MGDTTRNVVAASCPAAPLPSGDQTATGKPSAAAARSGKEAALMASQGLQTLGLIIALRVPGGLVMGSRRRQSSSRAHQCYVMRTLGLV